MAIPLTVAETRLTLTNANTEYSHTFDVHTRSATIRCQTFVAVNYSFSTGNVTVDSAILPAGSVLCLQEEDILANKVNDGTALVYFACATAGVKMEIMEY